MIGFKADSWMRLRDWHRLTGFRIDWIGPQIGISQCSLTKTVGLECRGNYGGPSHYGISYAMSRDLYHITATRSRSNKTITPQRRDAFLVYSLGSAANLISKLAYNEMQQMPAAKNSYLAVHPQILFCRHLFHLWLFNCQSNMELHYSTFVPQYQQYLSITHTAVYDNFNVLPHSGSRNAVGAPGHVNVIP